MISSKDEMIARLVEMGYPIEAVADAIGECKSVEEVIDRLSESQSQKRKLNASLQNVSQDLANQLSRNIPKDKPQLLVEHEQPKLEDKNEPEEKKLGENEPPKDIEKPQDKEIEEVKLDELSMGNLPGLEERLTSKSLELCVLCMDRLREIVFMPCRHFMCCPRCTHKLTNCPICKQKIQQHLRVYHR